MTHYQRGYAAVDFIYTFTVRRIEQKQMVIDEHAAFQDTTEFPVDKTTEETWKKTFGGQM